MWAARRCSSSFDEVGVHWSSSKILPGWDLEASLLKPLSSSDSLILLRWMSETET